MGWRAAGVATATPTARRERLASAFEQLEEEKQQGDADRPPPMMATGRGQEGAHTSPGDAR
jgi:hypothetical protein